ncbi:response regulator [Helcococcus ovis]|uniref:Response regulator n=4 Tax=Helcococcus ovis TaxID=72026 RepID=A0A4R9C2K7_9FIRM|nr:response regulator [Helcococcus ovis]TFF64651.1 response regulator [Helcococcus ovis]TFF65702.1 response regulator [Helcococcus ovis]TFF66828.1 response regulator [Helcococcus ovis]WNZ00521.1 response regulator [Helcococcus ovis]
MYKVLLVEDELFIRRGLTYLFNWEKVNCTIIGEAENGQIGLEMIKKLNPDIVILDINMPILGGLDMLKQVKNKNFESIILSGYDEFEYAKDAINQNAIAYLLKPVDYDELKNALNKAISNIKKNKDILNLEIELNSKLDRLNLDTDDVISTNSKTTLQVIEFIKKNYKQKINIDDLIRITNKGKTSILQNFKEDTNQTLTEYINIFRIKKAIKLMYETNYSIENISYEVGFSNYRYFSSVFKKYMDITPSEFIKQYNN